MVDLGPKRSPLFRGKLQHISPQDRSIFLLFLEIYEPALEALFYDVRVGKGVEAPKNTSEKMAIMFKKNTQRRIDVVAKFIDNKFLYICEIRPNAGPGSVGNAITNFLLFSNEDPRPSKPAIITDILAQDMQLILNKLNIVLFETNS